MKKTSFLLPVEGVEFKGWGGDRMSETPYDPLKERAKHEKAAVALQYDKATDKAPRITAKGFGHIAEQIIAIAKEAGVEIQEDKELVQILASLEVDTLIPLEAYAAVAEILSYVYQTNAESKQRNSRAT